METEEMGTTKEMKVRGISTFKSLNISGNKVVTLKFKMRYDEIVTSVQLLQGLNCDITVLAKIGGSKPKSLGLFTVGGINFDKDGNAEVTLKSLTQNVELNNITELVEEELIQLMFRTIIELEDKEGE